ncbi:RNA polymerase sigma factor [Algibacter sp. PT7-4]|uniref:RNA polymerase sigma factor n=1 Tax=Algibacter ulvanivorans TaxID=3400999 RepID=UPI003AAE0276
MTNEELIFKIVNNKETHLFEVLYDRFSFQVYNKCFSFVNNEEEAKDLAQDIFLKLYIKLFSFKGKSKFSTWLYSITYNHCVNYINRNNKRKYEKRMPETFSLDNIPQDIEVKDQVLENKLTVALDRIPAADRSILALKYQDNLSNKSIERVLGIGESAVKMRIKRAKERLVSQYAVAV